MRQSVWFYHSLRFQVRFIPDHQHWKLISIFHTQNLSMELENFFKAGKICHTEHEYESYKDMQLIIFQLDPSRVIQLPSPDRMYCSLIAENSSCPAVSKYHPEGNHTSNHSIINNIFHVLTQDIKFRWHIVNHYLLQWIISH